MTIDEAIKINTINNDHNPDYTDDERQQAHQLGIEALEFRKTIFTRIEASLQWLVTDNGTWDWKMWEELKLGCRLPSETES